MAIIISLSRSKVMDRPVRTALESSVAAAGSVLLIMVFSPVSGIIQVWLAAISGSAGYSAAGMVFTVKEDLSETISAAWMSSRYVIDTSA